jgi:hypothetical protein
LYLQIEKEFQRRRKILKDGFWPGAFRRYVTSFDRHDLVTRFEDADETKNVKWSQLLL